LLSHTTNYQEPINKKPSYRYDSRPYCLAAALGVTLRHLSRDHLIAFMPFPIGGPLEPSLYSNGFRDIQRRMLRNGWRNLDTTSKQRS